MKRKNRNNINEIIEHAIALFATWSESPTEKKLDQARRYYNENPDTCLALIEQTSIRMALLRSLTPQAGNWYMPEAAPEHEPILVRGQELNLQIATMKKVGQIHVWMANGEIIDPNLIDEWHHLPK